MKQHFAITRLDGLVQIWIGTHGYLGDRHDRSVCLTLENLRRRFEISLRVGSWFKAFRIRKVWVR